MSAVPSTQRTQFARSIPLDLIDPSPTNPRKTFGDLSELVASIKSSGVLQPVLVREGDEGRYELVFGHRRFKAACGAGLVEIPAIIATMNDVEVLQAQLIENSARADIHPLEEADGYRRLHDDHGMSGEEIAEKVGKSKAAVYARMKLADLVDADLRAAFLDGTLPASTALLLARLTPEMQTKIASDVLSGEEVRNAESGAWESRPLSVRAVEGMLKHEYFLARGENDENFVELVAEREEAERRVKATAERLKKEKEAVKKTIAKEKTAAKGAAPGASDAQKAADAKRVILQTAAKNVEAALFDMFAAKIKAKPELDAKILRLLLAFAIDKNRWAMAEPLRRAGQSKGGVTFASLGALKADTLRVLAFEAAIALDDQNAVDLEAKPGAVFTDAIYDAGKIFGVDVGALEKKAKLDIEVALAEAAPKPALKRGDVKKIFEAATAGPKKTLAKVKAAGKKAKQAKPAAAAKKKAPKK